MNEINKIRSEKVSPTELKDAKASYVGSFVMALEKPETIAQYALNIQREHLPDDFYSSYLQKLNNVDIDGVQKAAQKYIEANHEAIVVVGKAADVLPGLEKLPYHIVYLDKEGNLAEKPEINKPIPAGVTATTVLDDYFKAIGGRDKVDAVKTMYYKYDATIQGMTLTLEVKLEAPNKASTTTLMMGNVMGKQVFDGEKAYTEARGQKQFLGGKALEAMKADSKPFSEYNYLKSAKLLKIEPVDGRDTYVLQVTDNKKAYYSIASGLKVKEMTTAKAPNGKDMNQNVYFSDYKPVDGIMIAHKRTMNLGPKKVDFIISDVKVNSGVSDDDFK
jgi:hypothetical protein